MGVETHCCFLDIKKAYDRVFRVGLWKRMLDVGIKGKLWRIIKQLYDVVESSVLVGNQQTGWFGVDVGLRQGCNLSPILFAIFIDGIARKVKEAKQGIKIQDLKLNIMLFADDLILLGSSRKELQNLIDIVWEYSNIWKFTFNSNKSKVVVFGKIAPRGSYFLGFEQLEVVNQFKYLGVDFQNNLSWKDHKIRIAKKAHSRIAVVNKAIAEGLTTETGEKLWTAMIRPILEYGAEIWGGGRWLEAEQIMRKVGRILLGLSRTANNEVVQGELGWWKMEGRRDFIRLKYWGKLLKMSAERLPRRIYEISKMLTENTKGSWSYITKTLLINLNLAVAWINKTLERTVWTALLKQRIRERESREWGVT